MTVFQTNREGPSRALLATIVAGMALAGATGCHSTHRRKQPSEQVGPASATLPSSERPKSGHHAAVHTTPTSTSLAQTSEKPADFGKPLTPEQQVRVHLDLARAAETQQDIEASLEQYQKALEAIASGAKGMKPAAAQASRALVHRRMAATLDRAGQFEQAEAQYKLALKEAPADPKIWNDMGYSYYLQGKWDQAQHALSRACEIDGQDKRALTNLGLARAAGGDVQGAFDVLSRAGTMASAHVNIGYVLAASGKAEEAREHFREALRLQPSLKTANQALAQIDKGTTRRDPNVAVASVPGPSTVAKVERASMEASR
jgi:tetratricopeptide (TPR) repeat protein